MGILQLDAPRSNMTDTLLRGIEKFIRVHGPVEIRQTFPTGVERLSRLMSTFPRF